MTSDLLAPITVQLLELFQGPLRDVRFPDADSERLGAAVDAAKQANEALAKAEAAVAVAREALAEKQRTVLHETERTLAYARVYAVDRPDLRDALDALNPPPAAVRRGKGRPRKDAADTASKTPAKAKVKAAPADAEEVTAEAE